MGTALKGLDVSVAGVAAAAAYHQQHRQSKHSVADTVGGTQNADCHAA